MPTSKRLSITKERDKALKAFQHARRLQEVDINGYGHCWTCGTLLHVSMGDAGHGLEKGNHRGTELVPMNCHLQCRRCNRYEYGCQYEYMIHVKEVYGQEAVDRIYDMDRAYRGNQEAMGRLSSEDRAFLQETRTAAWYHEQYVYWSRICKELAYKEAER